MKILIYSETPAAKEAREFLKKEGHSVILCNPDHFRAADAKEVDEIHFPKDHARAAEVETVCSATFPVGHPRAGQQTELVWITPPKPKKEEKEKEKEKEK